MIQNEVTEIKKIMTKNDCCIHGLAGCYVDANKEMHILEQGKFLVLPCSRICISLFAST